MPLPPHISAIFEVMSKVILRDVFGGLDRETSVAAYRRRIRRAYKASFMLYWADRKGFNICLEEQSLAAVATFAKRGAKYYFAAKNTLQRRSYLEDDLRQTYSVLAECNGYILFQLTPGKTNVEK